ncbi:MAG: hypothetical protein Q9195_001806 [Heterodermia aff. obscurata]
MAETFKKRRKTASAVEEIKFDPLARQDYLTGFHKRKLQRAKHAKEEAAKRDREEKITARKLLRAGRKADLEKHVAEVNSLLQRELDSDLDNSGREDNMGEKDEQGESNRNTKASNADLEVEYADEDRYTTVTVEAVEVSRDGLYKTPEDEVLESDGEGAQVISPQSRSEARGRASGGTPQLSKARSLDLKRKKRKFKYESKAERKMTRHKERTKNSARAKDRRSK